MEKWKGLSDLSLTPESITYSSRTLKLCLKWSSSRRVWRSKPNLYFRLIGIIQFLTCDVLGCKRVPAFEGPVHQNNPKPIYLISRCIQTNSQSTIGFTKKTSQLGNKPTSWDSDFARTEMKALLMHHNVCSFYDIVNIMQWLTHSLQVKKHAYK